MPSPDTLLSPGSAATVRVPPRAGLAHLAGATCSVVSIRAEIVGGRSVIFATIHADDGTEEGIVVPDVPASYLAPTLPKRRRSPLNLHAPKDTRSEAERQAEGVAWLRAHGYTVIELGKGRKGVRCRDCGTFAVPTGWQGNDPGAPDTVVTRDSWPASCALLLEWKDGEKGARTKEQAELEAAGRIAVVWDLRTCLMAVYAFERADPRIMPNPDLMDWLMRHAGPGAATGEMGEEDA
jgi:hypothetical protein